MSLRPLWDVSPADWLVRVDGSMGPRGYDAYARLRFIPDPAYEGQSENDVQYGSEDDPSEIDQLRVVGRVLAHHTASVEWFFAHWDGWPDTVRLDTATFCIPHRRYFLYGGTARELDEWPTYPPAMIWPADRAWFVAKDVDPHYAGIGGSAQAVDALLGADLDIVRADFDAEQPAYR